MNMFFSTLSVFSDFLQKFGMQFKPLNFVSNLKYMGIGMLIIFAIILLIIIVTTSVNKFFSKK